MRESAGDSGVVSDLPVLRAYVADLMRERFAFDGTTVMIIVQHLLRTNVELIRSMLSLGLAPERVFVLGKGYSTDQRCCKLLRGLGVNVTDDLPPPNPGEYAARRDQEIDKFWTSIGGDRLLGTNIPVIIDDVGGRLLLKAARAPRVSMVSGVEQTTSGVRRLENQSLEFPVINLARSAAKLEHESPLLASEILRRMDSMPLGRWPNGQICVVGSGSVGSSLFSALEARGSNVTSFDLSSNDLRDASRSGILPERIAEADFIFGCTGQELFDGVPLTEFRTGVTFVNCSSEDVEFAPILRQAARRQSMNWPVADVQISIGGRSMTVLNGGFPLNFDNSGISLPEQSVQLTTALTLAGIVTAARHCIDAGAQSSARLIELPSSVQNKIVAHFLRNSGQGEIDEHLRDETK